MERLRDAYRATLPERAQRVQELKQALAKGWGDGNAADLRVLAHQLAGSGGAYGFPDITATARVLEIRLATLMEVDGQGFDEQSAAFVQESDALIGTLSEAATDGGGTTPEDSP